jgi:hypothetical protein
MNGTRRKLSELFKNIFKNTRTLNIFAELKKKFIMTDGELLWLFNFLPSYYLQEGAVGCCKCTLTVCRERDRCLTWITGFQPHADLYRTSLLFHFTTCSVHVTNF